MQSVRSRIWTRVAVSISLDDNHYTKGTSIRLYLIISLILSPKIKSLKGIYSTL